MEGGREARRNTRYTLHITTVELPVLSTAAAAAAREKAENTTAILEKKVTLYLAARLFARQYTEFALPEYFGVLEITPNVLDNAASKTHGWKFCGTEKKF